MSLEQKYKNEILQSLKEELQVSNIMDVPKVEKVVVNMGIGSYIRAWNKDYSSLQRDLSLITGQAPVVRYASKSISNFKLREWMPVGLTVTLRWENMYNFLEKVIDVVLPRVRDFRWISRKSFDKAGNFNFWVTEHTIFPEVPQDDVVKPHGIQITVKTTATNPDAGRALLQKMEFPFVKK